MSPWRSLAVLAWCLASLLVGLAGRVAPSVATAQAAPEPVDICFSAPVEGQTLHRAGELLAAKQRFAACAQQSCPSEIIADLEAAAGELSHPPPLAAASERPVPAAVWIVGGVGVLGMASFGSFGVLGLSERARKHCDTGCTPGQKASVDAKYLVADVSLGVGVVALGVATWLYLARPEIAPTEHAALESIDVRVLRSGAFAAYRTKF